MSEPGKEFVLKQLAETQVRLRAAEADLAGMYSVVDLCRAQDTEYGRVVGENFHLKRQLARFDLLIAAASGVAEAYRKGNLLNGDLKALATAVKVLGATPTPAEKETLVPAAHGITSHAWPCCDRVPKVPIAVKCGGPGVCRECLREVATIHNGTKATGGYVRAGTVVADIAFGRADKACYLAEVDAEAAASIVAAVVAGQRVVVSGPDACTGNCVEGYQEQDCPVHGMPSHGDKGD